MSYRRIPGVDEQYRFPSEVQQAIANSPTITQMVDQRAQSKIDATPIGEQALRFCSLGISSNISVPSGTLSQLSWNLEVEDPNNMHNTTNLNRVYCTLAGLYLVNVVVRWSGATGGERSLILNRNDTRFIDRSSAPNETYPVATSISEVVRLNVGQYISASLWHNAGATMTIQALINGARSTTLTMSRIGS